MKDISNFNELYEYVKSFDDSEFLKMLKDDYAYNKEKYYQSYKAYRYNIYRNQKKYHLVLAHCLLGHIGKILGKVPLKKFKESPFSSGRFGQRPFEYLFNMSTLALYQDNCNVSPTFEHMALDIKQNISKYKAVYDLLEDEVSKNVLFLIIMARLTGNPIYLTKAYLKENPGYIEDFVYCKKGEVYLDCGAYNGDTTTSYINHNPDFKKIISYEPDSKNAQIAIARLNDYIKRGMVEVRIKGISNYNGKIYFNDNHGSSSNIDISGDIDTKTSDYIDVVKIDEDVDMPVTFIKMDIEGSELMALEGAYNHIRADIPKLAICAYHRVQDIWRIVEYITSISTDYKVYIRHYSYYFADTVLYFIPVEGGTK